MTDTARTIESPAEQLDVPTAGGRQLTPEQLQALAKEVLRLMRDELRGELERRGQALGRRRKGDR